MWEYLDRLDLNLLYRYAQIVSGEASYLREPNKSTSSTEDKNTNSDRCQKGFYLFWFVFRYILKCETLEQALEYANEETLRKYCLLGYVKTRNAVMYIGLENNKDVHFSKVEDTKIILEILYHRYSLLEQLLCYARHTTGCRRTRSIEAARKHIQTIKNTYNINLRECDRFKDALKELEI